jgi:putative DNA primase/helicase
MVSKREGNAPKPELLALRGARIVTAAESEKGAVLATGIVKQMTGGDPISARGLFKDTEIFFPEFTPIIATNNAPRIQDKTNAIWGRIKCWPFTVTIPEEQRIPDFDIRLFEEGSGILNWMIKGLKRYYAAGCQLAEPPELLASTNEYRADQDTVLKFIEARCTLGPKENVAQSLLYLEFETWCDETGEFAVSKKDFFKSFKDRKHRFYSPGNVRSIQGIRIKTSREIEEWDQQQNES